MLSVVRFFLFCFLLFGSSAQAREINILILGEGTAANCNQHAFPSVPDVFQLTREGGVKPAKDPLDLSGCSGGSVWIPFAQQLLNARVADRVVLSPIALEKTSVVEWAPNGKAFPALKSVIELANRKNIRFDYVLWQQGYSDEKISVDRYFSDLRKVIRYVTTNVKVGGWLIAKGAGCPGIVRQEVEEAQAKMGRLPVYRRFAGPDASKLAFDRLYGSCGLTQGGQIEMAKMWAEALFDAEKNAVRYQKESLLYYFR